MWWRMILRGTRHFGIASLSWEKSYGPSQNPTKLSKSNPCLVGTTFIKSFFNCFKHLAMRWDELSLLAQLLLLQLSKTQRDRSSIRPVENPFVVRRANIRFIIIINDDCYFLLGPNVSTYTCLPLAWQNTRILKQYFLYFSSQEWTYICPSIFKLFKAS